MTPDRLADAAEATLDLHELLRYTPVDLVLSQDPPLVRWMDLRGQSFDRPFFADVICEAESAVEPPETFFTEADALAEIAQETVGQAPSGFLFHLSRCGSTALARALAAAPAHRVVSEAGLINSIVLAGLYGVPRERQCLWLRGAVQALAAAQTGEGARFFLKLSSWNALRIDLFLDTFAEVPWAFVHRDPLEVLVSLLRKPPSWAAEQGRTDMWALLGASGEPPAELAEFLAAMLGGLCGPAARAAAGEALLVRHEEVAPPLLGRLLEHFRCRPTDAEILRMGERLGTYSKDPSHPTPWASDSAAKRAAATPRLRELIDVYVCSFPKTGSELLTQS